MLGRLLPVLIALAGCVIAAPSQLQAGVAGWSVNGLIRGCEGSPLTCTYNFTISTGSDSPSTACFFDDASADPNHNSLANVPCNTDLDNPWLISWGYNDQYDFAVMTVVNEAEQEDAWFGFNFVSTTTDFPDDGPNPVHDLGTLT